MAEKTVPIWVPLKDIVKESDVNEIERLLDGSLTLINVNMVRMEYSLLKTRTNKFIHLIFSWT